MCYIKLLQTYAWFGLNWLWLQWIFSIYTYVLLGRNSRCSDTLKAGRSRNRSPVGARFSEHFQTGPGAHPASYTMGNEVELQGRRVDHLTPSIAEVKERVELYLFSPFGSSLPVLGWTLPLLLPLPLPLLMYWTRKCTPVKYCLICIINRLHVSVVFATIIKMLLQ